MTLTDLFLSRLSPGHAPFRLNLSGLREVDRRAYYALLYGNEGPTAVRIDEEGCGSLVTAVLFGKQGETT
jgi:hypothetical protein